MLPTMYITTYMHACIHTYILLAVSGDQPDRGQIEAKRTGQVGKGGGKRGTRGVTEEKERGHRETLR